MKFGALLFSMLLGCFLLSLASCGKKVSSEKARPITVSELEEEKQEDQGIYRAVITPLNPKFAGAPNGSIEIRIDGDDFSVEGHILGAHSGVKHIQNIMSGHECPDLSSDTNQDGVVDFREASVVSGNILIPLDSDLSEQLLGIEFGPIGNAAGSFIYKRSTSFSMLLSDLKTLDPDPRDMIAKLEIGKELNLSGRVILIHGIDSHPSLPQTVSPLRNLSPELSLPVGCGKIIRVEGE